MMWFLPFLQPILNFFGGNVIKGITDAYKSKLDAGNTRDRIAAELAAKEFELEAKEAQLRSQILVAEQGHFFTRMVRPLWAIPFIVWTYKVVLWDKVLGWGVTDELHGAAAALLVTISGAYFIGRSIEKTASIIKGKSN